MPGRPRWPWATAALLLAGTYYTAGSLGLSFATLHESASPVWAPTGIAIAGLYLLGARAWPAVLAGAFLFNLQTSGNVAASLSIAIGNTLEGVAGASLARRFAGGARLFSTPAHVALFAVCALAASTISAAMGVASLVAAGTLVAADAPYVGLTWWLGDATGALIVAPPIILWAQGGLPRVSPRKALEAAALIAATVGLGVGVFWNEFKSAYVTIPVVLWAALRFQPRGAATVTMVLNALAVAGTVRGLGPFAFDDANVSLLTLQGFVAFTSLVGLFLVVLAAQNRKSVEAVGEARDFMQARAEERARELTVSETRFAAFMNDLPGLAWIKDREGRYVYGNEAFASRLGMQSEALVGRTDKDLFPPSTAATYRSNDERVLETNHHLATIEEQPVGGRTLSSLVRKFPIHDSAGNIVQVAGIAVDITEQREAESRLHDSESALREAQGTARLGSWEWDVGSGAMKWSEQMYRLYGVEPGRPVTVDSLRELAHPADRSLVEASIRDAVRQAGRFEFGQRIQLPGGGERWLHAAGFAHAGPDGRVTKVTGTAQDVTERRLSDERFRLLIEANPDALVIVDATGSIVRVNRQTELLLGYERAELIGQPVEILVPEAVRDRHVGQREEYSKAPKSRPMGIGRDLQARRKDGTMIPVEISLSPLKTPEGLLVMSAIRDVSERRRAMKEREELERLRQVNDFKTRFINMAAHELNTPLTPLKLQAHLLRSGATGALNEAQRRSAEILERNLDRVANLVQNMLDVGRIQSGRIELRRSSLSLAGALGEAVESFEESARQAGVKLDVSLEGDPWVDADAQRVSQILFNLLSNALKFTGHGGRIHVEGKTVNGEAEIGVSDTGSGLTPEQIERLFQPFSQVHEAAQTAAKPGTGLGLYISRQLVQLHGGRMWAESPGVGHGSRFAFTLPLKSAPAAAAGAAPSVGLLSR